MVSIQTAFENEWENKTLDDISKGFYFQIENAFSFSDNELEKLYKVLQTKHRKLFNNITGSNSTFA